jgi:hypothetical protein
MSQDVRKNAGLLVVGMMITILHGSAAEFSDGMVLLGESGLGQVAADKDVPPQAFPAEIVEVWRQRGAEVGWMRVDQFGFTQFVEEDEVRGILATCWRSASSSGKPEC